MTREEKIKKLEDFCNTWKSCCLEYTQCPMINLLDDDCDWDDMTDAQLDRCIMAIGDASSQPDAVQHPAHYNQGGIECIDAMAAATVNKRGIEAICVSNVIKYLFRYETKNGLEDVKKAAWYLNRLIDEMEAKE